MKKVFALLIAVLAMFQLASAANVGDNLYVKTKDGKSVSYALSTRPVVTFSGTDLVLTASDVQVKYPIADVEEINFQEPTAVQDIKDGHIAFTINSNEILANGLQNGETVEVFSIEGKQVAASTSNATGAASVDISSLSHGVYVVKAGKKTYKILK